MFSTDFNGYNKKEVDAYIANLKADYEKTLMEERLKVLDGERKILEMKRRAQEIDAKEKNIATMLESFKKYQEDGNRNIEVLRAEQLRMVYQQIVDFLEKLNERDPGLLLNSGYKKLLAEIRVIIDSNESKQQQNIETGTENDPMRLLLSKMQGRRVQDNPREVKIERIDRTPFIKPVTQMQLNENDNYDNLVDKFLDTKPPEEQPRAMKIQSSGFDLKEAINPKDDLSEIMKAFDFYGGDDEDL